MRKVKGPAVGPLTRQQVQKCLSDMEAALRHEPVLAGYVFGSYGRLLRGQEGPGPLSDFDVALLLVGPGSGSEPAEHPDMARHLRLLGLLVDTLHRDDVDLVILNSAPPALRFAVLQDGVPFGPGSAAARLQFEVAVLRTYQDMEPYRRRWQAERLRRLREGPS